MEKVEECVEDLIKFWEDQQAYLVRLSRRLCAERDESNAAKLLQEFPQLLYKGIVTTTMQFL